MRLLLNLNQYYDGLDISQVNNIFAKFIDLKIYIDQMKIILNKPEEKRTSIWKATLEVYSESIVERVNEINLYMESLGKEKIFEVRESIENTNFEAIISKYEYLMSAPQKEEKNSVDKEEYGER